MLSHIIGARLVAIASLGILTIGGVASAASISSGAASHAPAAGHRLASADGVFGWDSITRDSVPLDGASRI